MEKFLLKLHREKEQQRGDQALSLDESCNSKPGKKQVPPVLSSQMERKLGHYSVLPTER